MCPAAVRILCRGGLYLIVSCGLYPVSVWKLASCVEVEIRNLCHRVGDVYPVSLCRWCVSCVIV